MIELLVAGGLLLALLGGAALVAWLSVSALAWTSVVLMIGGLVVGIPAGIAYHVALARTLRGRLPPRWWLSPVAQHALLGDADRPRVLPWFALGAFGAGASIVGCALLLVAILRT